MEPWEILESHYVFRSRWMNLRRDRVRLPGGAELEAFHVVELPDWACVLCFTDASKLLLVEQYRHGLQRWSLEFPAGAIDGAEEPLAAAKRELVEETGYVAEEWSLLGRCAPEPSKHTNEAYLYVARGARQVHPQRLDESEDLRVHLLDPQEVLRRAEAGAIVHGIHLTAFFWAQHRGLFGG